MTKRVRRIAAVSFVVLCGILGFVLQACADKDVPSDIGLACNANLACPDYLGCGTDNICHSRCDFGASCNYGSASTCVNGLCYYVTYNGSTGGSNNPNPNGTSSCSAAPLVRSDLPPTASSGSVGAVVDDKYLYYLAATTDAVGNTSYAIEEAALDGTGTPTNVRSVQANQVIDSLQSCAVDGYLFYNDANTGALTRTAREGAHQTDVVSTTYSVAGAKGSTLFVRSSSAFGNYYRMTSAGVVDPTPILPPDAGDSGSGPTAFPELVFSESKVFFVYRANFGSPSNMYVADIASGAAVDSGHSLPQNANSPFMGHGSKLYYPVTVNSLVNLVEVDLGDPSSTATAIRQNMSSNVIGMDDGGFLYFVDGSNPSTCGQISRFPVTAPTSTPTSLGVLPDYQIQTQEIIGVGAVYAFESFSYGPTTGTRHLYRYKTN